MLKARLNCPICGDLILAKSLEGHLERVHELTGNVTLRLHPVSPYQHEPEAEAEVVELAPPEGGKEEGKEAETATTSEPEAETETEPEPEPEPS